MKLALLLLPSLAVAAATVRVDHLRCEYRNNPQGVETTEPRLSWILTPTNPKARGVRQGAYRILAASTESALAAGNGDLWDTRIESDQSIQVVYAGKPLTSGAQVFWKVQVWDQDGVPSEWSNPAQWTMGLLDPSDWHAKWIGRDEKDLPKPPDSPYLALADARWIWNAPNAQTTAPVGDVYFHETIAIPADLHVKRATCIAGGDTSADLFINGKPVIAAANAGIPTVKDITSQLHYGDNLIAVRGTHARADRPAGFIAAIKVEFTTGDPLVVVTNNHWRAAVKVEDGWEKPEYIDAAWQSARELGAYGVAPWGEAGFQVPHWLTARMLRKEFAVERKVRRATVHYSGLGLSELYLDGAKVGDHVLSPGLTDYDKHVLYETFDVTRQLAAGRHAIGLMLGNGRFHAPRGDPRTRDWGSPKAIVQLNLEYDDGSRSELISDETWKLSADGPVRGNNEYDGEEYDARMEIPGWSRPGFDDSKWEDVQLVSAPSGVLTSQMAEPLRVTQTLTPLTVKQLKPGVYIVDMGQNMVGWCRLKVSGAKGTHVRLRHAETLNPDGSLYVANLRTARAADTYILKGGSVETWEPRFTYHGFRYVEITGFPGVPTPTALQGRVVHDDMARTADFTSSNDLLNKIHHNIYWGVRGNYRSIPTDCPQRDERQGWLGDRSQVSRSEAYMFDVAAFYTKWEQDIADSQRQSGSIPTVSPNYWPNYHDDLTWPSTFLFVPGMLYEQYGDTRVLARFYPAMKQWLAHERGFLQKGLMPQDMYGDWCVPPEDPKLIHSQDPTRITDKTLLGTTYYYHLLHQMARYARMLDREPDASDFEMEANKINDAFQKRFFKPASMMYDNGTQTSSILPLYFQMVPEEYRVPVMQTLVRNIEEVSKGHVGTGLVGAQWLMRTLTENGRGDVAYEIATQKTYPGWGYMVQKGATTVWELWNGDTADPAMNSGNHVMQIGDLGLWMYEYLAGMRPDPEKPAFHHAIIRPYPLGNLSFVKASHETEYGKLASAWRREPGAFTLDLTIPANTTATVWLPAKTATSVTESGKPAKTVRGVKFVTSEAGNVVFEVQSGTYSFRAAM